MWRVGLCVVALLVICCTHWINKWRNPKCNGTLPPGSMGLPLIGETLQLIIPSYSLDLPPFIKKRLQRYGPIFRTSLLGRPVIISADPEFNHFIYQQEGKLVELWYLDTISTVFSHESESRTTAGGLVHRYLRSITLNHFGSENIKEKMLPQIEDAVNKALRLWSSQASVEVQRATSVMVYDFNAKQMIGHDAEKSSKKISEMLIRVSAGFMAYPLNIPGTTHHKCLKEQKKMVNMLKDILKERLTSPNRHRGDFLDQAINDIDTKKFLTEDFVVNLVFGVLFASGSVSGAMTLIFKLLAENPSVLQELTAEHEAILKKRENPDSSLTWDEYKSMTFTLQVINETLRLSNAMPFLLRRAVKDIQANGYTIPEGWTIMVVNSALHLNPDTYKDPLAFNPSRWKDLDSCAISKSFMPFGGGTRQCAGAEYSKVFVATFLHVLVTKYRWIKIKGGEIARSPILGFGDGIHIKFSEMQN